MRRFIGIASLLLALPIAAHAATGGPDAFGYTWSDQEEPGIDNNVPTAVGGSTDVMLGANQVSASIPFGFNFPFYGATYPSFVISSEGWFSFDTGNTNPDPVARPIPNSIVPNTLLAWYWRDLDAPSILRYHNFNGGLAVLIRQSLPGQPSPVVQAWIVFYQSGSIKVVYQGTNDPTTASAGIENAAGNDGLQPWHQGVGSNGFVLASGSIVQYFPPAGLDCNTPTTINCGDTLSSTSPGPLPTNVNNYLCSPDTFSGNERVFLLNNPGIADLDITLTSSDPGRDQDVFLLQAGFCDEWHCISGGTNSIFQPFLSPGDYVIVVDGKTAADDGAFDLSVSCTSKSGTLACGTSATGTTSGISQFSTYPCTNQDMSGPEFIWEVPFTAPGNLLASITPDPGVELDIMAFGPDNFDAPDGCVSWSDNNLLEFNPPSGTYFLVVDGRNGADGGYSIDVSCDVKLDCAAPAGDLLCFQETMGSTTAAANAVEIYSCAPDRFDGNEVVYQFFNDRRRTVSFMYNGPADMSIFIVPDSCNEGGCIEFGTGRLIARDLDVGNYFVVVDGKNGVSGDFSITPVCDNIVTPPTGMWTLDPGTITHEAKSTTLNADITRGDVVFAMDFTGSMGPALDNLKTTSQDIITELSSIVDDVQFGLVSFEDYPTTHDWCFYTGQYGVATDSPYRLNLPVTNDQALLFSAIDDLQLGNGADFPESYSRVLFEMYSDATNIGWRPGSRRLMVMIGDDEPHTCDANACLIARSTTGIDPGRDEMEGTADDLEVTAVVDEMGRQGITPFYLNTVNPNNPINTDIWECWMARAGGRAFEAPQGRPPGGIIEELRQNIEDKSLRCDILEVEGSLGFENWVLNVTPPNYVDVSLPVQLTFDFDIGPPLGTPPGLYNFTVDMVCDGVIKASQVVTIEVPGACVPPTGSTANGLLMARQLNDALLDWRGAPTNPRNYNVHREVDKRDLDPNPVNPPLGQASSDELYIDTDAVPVTAGPLLYYQVYARDCAGASVFD